MFWFAPACPMRYYLCHMQPRRAKHIVVLGDINADITVKLPAYPIEGDDCTAQELRWGSGGAALNAATTFAILGGKARLFGCVGADPAATIALRAAQQAGVDLSAIQTDPRHATGLCIVSVSASGQRTFFSFRGANVWIDPAAITPDIFDDVALFHLNAHALLEGPQQAAALRAVELATAEGVPIALDLSLPSIRQCRDIIMRLLPQLWLICMNEDELRLLLPGQRRSNALDMFKDQGAQHIALKLGAHGCILADAHTHVAIAPPSVPVVDTTGCGDAFAAGCAWALLHRANLPLCGTLGNLLGALTATRIGAADALPTRAELDPWLAAPLAQLLDGTTTR